jgi:hypothetical protein
MTDKKNTSITWALIITSLITLAGWFILNCLNSERERKNKLRDIRVSYLIDAYRKLANASQRSPSLANYHRDVESAISDIQLFGTETQIDLLKRSINNVNYDSLVKFDYDPILNDLRNSLRKEIDLSPLEGNVQWFRLHEIKEDSLEN